MKAQLRDLERDDPLAVVDGRRVAVVVGNPNLHGALGGESVRICGGEPDGVHPPVAGPQSLGAQADPSIGAQDGRGRTG